MYNFIPSRDVREYAEKIGRVFTDFEKAAVIYRSGKPKQEISEKIKKLAETTEDETLRKQVNEHLEFDRECRRIFWEDTDGFVYLLVTYEEFSYANLRGCFTTPKAAYELGKQCEDEFFIYKYQLINSMEDEPLGYKKNADAIYMKLKLPPLGMKQCYGMPVSECIFDREGKEKFFWGDMEISDDIRIDKSDPKRFESAYVDMPNPFEEGDEVIELDTGKRGWVATTRERWDKEREDIKSGKYPEADSTFGALVIIYDKENPENHDHPYPEMIEKCRDTDDRRENK